MSYHFEMKVRIVYPEGEELLYLHDRPSATEFVFEPRKKEDIPAVSYYWDRSLYAVQSERITTIHAFKNGFHNGMELINSLTEQFSDERSVYILWRGIRRGIRYRFILYAFVTDEDRVLNIENEVLERLKKFEIDYSVSKDNFPKKENASETLIFNLDSIDEDEFVDFNEPKCICYFEGENHNLEKVEKYTKGFKFISWDRDIPPEGDPAALAASIVTIVSSVVMMSLELWDRYRCWREEKDINKWRLETIRRYGIDGTLRIKDRKAMNKEGDIVYIFEDEGAHKRHSFFEVNPRTGKIRRLV